MTPPRAQVSGSSAAHTAGLANICGGVGGVVVTGIDAPSLSVAARSRSRWVPSSPERLCHLHVRDDDVGP